MGAKLGMFWGQWGRTILIALAVCAVALTVGYCKGESAGRAKADAERALANVEAQTRDATARDTASEDRVEDVKRDLDLKKDLLDAIKDTPDTAPDAVRVELGCERLRKQGANTAAIPACGGR